MRHVILFTVFLLIYSPGNAESLTERRISSADIGTVVFLAPENWDGLETYDELEAASVYELTSRKEKFRLRLSVRYFGEETSNEQIIARLDGYLKYAISEQLENPDRYEVRAARFAPGNHGIYARVGDRAPAKGSHPFYTHGARVLGNKFITFSLNSSDADLSILKATLDIVMSFDAKNEWANAPESFLCIIDQVIGYAYADGEWDVVNSKKRRTEFILRRSRPDDEFADTSEWVYSGTDDEPSQSSCDNDYIAQGEFVCKGKHYEVFRMDTRTLRFIYAYLFGYHDVPPGQEPDEESIKPQMSIGSCTAQ